MRKKSKLTSKTVETNAKVFFGEFVRSNLKILIYFIPFYGD